MEKLIALLVAVALLVSASATVFALSTTTTRKTDHAQYEESLGVKYDYYCDVNATTRKANASMSYGNSTCNIYCDLSGKLRIYDNYFYCNDSDLGSSSVSASVTSTYRYKGKDTIGTMVSATGVFKIRSVNIATLTVT